MNTGNNPLENFSGFDNISNTEDLFNSTEEIETEEEQEEEEEEQEKDISKKEPEEEKEEKSDFFSNFEEDEEDEEENDEDKRKESSSVVEYFKEKGYYNEEKDGELEPDDLFDKAVESRMEEMFSELPDIAKQFNKFVTKGGDPEQFFKTIASEYSQSPELTEDLDITDKKNQELVLRTMLAKDGNDQEEIDAQIEYFKDSGKLESISKKKFEKWKEQKNKTAEKLAQQKAQDAIEEKRRLREDKRELSSYLQKNDKIGDIPFTPHDKAKLASYMIDKSVSLKDGRKITEFQKDLYYELPKNQDAFMQLGVMMRNRNEDGTFNFEAIKEELETKISGKARKNIRNTKGKGVKGSGAGSKKIKKKSLAEMFD